MLEIGIIFLLILINGALAMSEAGVVAANKLRLREQAKAGLRGADRALATVESPVGFLSTVQVGITLIGIFSGVFGGAMVAEDIAAWLARVPALQPAAEPIALVLVVVVITYCSLVIGELAPKRLAIEHPETVARVVAKPMGVLAAAASPAVHFLTFSTNLILKPFGVGAQRTERVSEEEIRGMIRLGAAAGVIEEAEHQVIERVLALADRRVGSFMIPRRDVITLELDAPWEEIGRVARTAPGTHLPVARGGGLDGLVGVVSLLDLAHAGGRPLRALVRPPLFIPESADALRALQLFRASHAQLAFVTDEHGTIDGMIRLGDLLEGMLGEAGVHPPDGEMLVRREDGDMLVDGLMPLVEFLREVGEQSGELFDPSSYHTVAGLVLHHLGRLADTGDVVRIGSYTFEVVDLDGRRIDKLLVRGPEEPVAGGGEAR